MDSKVKDLVVLLIQEGATAAEVALVQALIEIKHSLDEQTDAIHLLARATAGEFDQDGGEVEPAVDLSGRPIR